MHAARLRVAAHRAGNNEFAPFQLIELHPDPTCREAFQIGVGCVSGHERKFTNNRVLTS